MDDVQSIIKTRSMPQNFSRAACCFEASCVSSAAVEGDATTRAWSSATFVFADARRTDEGCVGAGLDEDGTPDLLKEEGGTTTNDLLAVDGLTDELFEEGSTAVQMRPQAGHESVPLANLVPHDGHFDCECELLLVVALVGRFMRAAGPKRVARG